MRLIFAQLALALFQIDLAVKHEIDEQPDEQPEQMLPGGMVGIKKLHNHGTAGGRHVGHMPEIIRVSGTVTAAGILCFIRSLVKPESYVRRTGWAFLTGGALSNLYDRCRKGYVVDYIRFHTPWKRLNDLVFNLADFFILIGAVLISIGKED